MQAGQLRQGLGIDGIGLGLLEQSPGAMVGLRRDDHT